MRTFSVKGFEKFQHYKDRSPPWIKFYNALLDDYDFGALPDAAKYHLVAIWLLASRSDNKVPYDPAWVAGRINAKTEVDLGLLVEAGFILLDQPLHKAEHVASTPQAKRLSRVEGDGEREAETKLRDVVERASEKTEVPKDEGSGPSKERAEAISLGLHFLKAAGFEDYAAAPMNWYGVADRAALWIERGWSPAMIAAEAKIVAARAGDTMPLSYFEKCFATAAARAAQDLPTAITPKAGDANVGQPYRRNEPDPSRSTSAAYDRLAKRLEQDDANAGLGGGQGFGRLLAQG
jgi:hypothetical protein